MTTNKPPPVNPNVTRSRLVIEVVNTWQEHFKDIGVSSRDIEDLAQRIDGDPLLSQRSGFDASNYTSGPPKTKRPSPFQRMTKAPGKSGR